MCYCNVLVVSHHCWCIFSSIEALFCEDQHIYLIKYVFAGNYEVQDCERRGAGYYSESPGRGVSYCRAFQGKYWHSWGKYWVDVPQENYLITCALKLTERTVSLLIIPRYIFLPEENQNLFISCPVRLGPRHWYPWGIIAYISLFIDTRE